MPESRTRPLGTGDAIGGKIRRTAMPRPLFLTDSLRRQVYFYTGIPITLCFLAPLLAGQHEDGLVAGEAVAYCPSFTRGVLQGADRILDRGPLGPELALVFPVLSRRRVLRVGVGEQRTRLFACLPRRLRMTARCRLGRLRGFDAPVDSQGAAVRIGADSALTRYATRRAPSPSLCLRDSSSAMRARRISAAWASRVRL